MCADYAIMEEIIDVGEHAFSLREISQIANDENILARYEKNYPNELYSMIMMSLTHKKYKENESRQLWVSIIKHRQCLNERLERDVGISVASLDYLTNIKGYLEEPKIIEDKKSKLFSEIALTDDLTGLYIREVFDVTLNREVERAKRNHQALSLVFIDIDNFKQINDRNGHLAGDEVLRKVANCIESSVREMDLPARYGGDEIAVIMPNTAIEDAKEVCDRIRKNVQTSTFESGVQVTISVGLSLYDTAMKNLEEFIDAADSALYKAKETGKNNVYHENARLS